jgi:S-adenosylmethionine hydrolase
VQPLLLPLPDDQEGKIVGEAWWVDHFGNVQTNIGPDDLALIGLSPGDVVTVKVGASIHLVQWARVYSDVDDGDLLVHVDSAGLLALAARSGRADERLNLAEGSAVTLGATISPTVG